MSEPTQFKLVTSQLDVLDWSPERENHEVRRREENCNINVAPSDYGTDFTGYPNAGGCQVVEPRLKSAVSRS